MQKIRLRGGIIWGDNQRFVFIEERWYCDNEIGKSQNETEEFEITWRNNLVTKE
jgi:hypothetical protein